MCYVGKNPEMAPLQQGHLTALQQFINQESKNTELTEFAQSAFSAWTRFLNPHLPIMPMFVGMHESWLNKDFGILADYQLVRLPLSIIGRDKVRYRSPILSFLHETVLSARMSDLAVDAFHRAANRHGICILYMCSCGVVMGNCADIAKFKNSYLHQEMDKLRSAIDAEGNPVKESLWEDMPIENMDLHPNGSELRMFSRIETFLTASLKAKTICMEEWIDNRLEEMIARNYSLELTP